MSFNALVKYKYFLALFLAMATTIECSAATNPTVSQFFCSKSAMLGAGTDVCTLVINPVPTASAVVKLSSSSAAVTVPASVIVPAKASSVQFSANVAAVPVAQAVTLTASIGSAAAVSNLNLYAAVQSLVVLSTSLSFPTTPVHSSAMQSVSVVSAGTVPITINASVTGSGFSLSGATFPLTLNPGLKATLTVQFTPTTAGKDTGQITITTSSTTSGPQTIALSGVGEVPAISGFSCNSSGMLGAGTDLCTVTLNIASTAAPATVSLVSNNAAVTLPGSVLVPENATSAQFTAVITPVSTAQAVTLTASAGGVSKTFAVNLSAATRNLVVETSNVAFSNQVVHTTVSKPVVLVSAGTEPVTVNATVTGAGFSIAGATFPLTINPGQTVSLNVQFTPVTATATTGVLAITSNATTKPTQDVPLSGTGTAVGAFPGSQVISILLPTAEAAPISADYFGMTIYNLASDFPSVTTGFTPFPTYKLSTLRLWDVAYWAMVESTQGKFNWTKLDGTIAAGQKNGVSDFIFTFGQAPTWASSNPTDPCPTGEGPGTCSAPNMADYDAFATTVVQRYCGKIKYYEPWNEPNNPQFWDGTNAQMLTIAKDLYQIAKNPANCGCTKGICSAGGGVNPNQVLLPPIAELTPASIAWLNSYLNSVGTNYPYADVATFHGYVWSGYAPETIIAGIQSLQQTLANYGLGDEQIWNTETSWEWNTDFTQQQQASWLMRTQLANAAAGVSRLVWYTYDSCNWGTLAVSSSANNCTNLTGASSALTPAGIAYGTVETWLSGASFTQCQQYQDGLWACELQRPGGYDAWMLWSSTATSLSVPIPSSLNPTVYRDWQNNLSPVPSTITVTQMPVLLESQDFETLAN